MVIHASASYANYGSYASFLVDVKFLTFLKLL